ncbi:MAG: polysaccharide deacetylase family protein [Planctomycetes bacterium]|nr:polysaccharide deacetylase family protein [Planctomycetota bacterium]
MSDNNVVLYIQFVVSHPLTDMKKHINAQFEKCRGAISNIVRQYGGIELENSSKQTIISLLNTPHVALSCASKVLFHSDCGENHIGGEVRIGINFDESNVCDPRQLHFDLTPLFLTSKARSGRIYVSKTIRSLVDDIDCTYADTYKSVKGNIEEFYEVVVVPEELTHQRSIQENSPVKFKLIPRKSEKSHKGLTWLASFLVAVLGIGAVIWFLPHLEIPEPQELQVQSSSSTPPNDRVVSKEIVLGGDVDTLRPTYPHTDKESEIPQPKTDIAGFKKDIDGTETGDYETEEIPHSTNYRGTNLSEFNGVITFDDGPHPSTTPDIVQLLTQAKVQNAVFFFVGNRILEYPELVSEVDNAGYEIGYHTMFHQNLANMSIQEIRNDIRDFRRVIYNILGEGYDITQGRPPFGGMLPDTVKVFRKLEHSGALAKTPIDSTVTRDIVHPNIIDAFTKEQLQLMLWNVDFDDWESKINPNEAQLKYSAKVRQIWLLHEQPIDWTRLARFENELVETLPGLLNIFSQLLAVPQSNEDLTWHIQRRLTELGYDPGPSDGFAGTKTQAAVKNFQLYNNLPVTGKLDIQLLANLRYVATSSNND